MDYLTTNPTTVITFQFVGNCLFCYASCESSSVSQNGDITPIERNTFAVFQYRISAKESAYDKIIIPST